MYNTLYHHTAPISCFHFAPVTTRSLNRDSLLFLHISRTQGRWACFQMCARSLLLSSQVPLRSAVTGNNMRASQRCVYGQRLVITRPANHGLQLERRRVTRRWTRNVLWTYAEPRELLCFKPHLSLCRSRLNLFDQSQTVFLCWLGIFTLQICRLGSPCVTTIGVYPLGLCPSMCRFQVRAEQHGHMH